MSIGQEFANLRMAKPEIFQVLIAPPVSLAGLLMVFVGFLMNRAWAAESSRRADVRKRAAQVGLVPMILALLCAGLSVLGTARVFDPGHVPLALFAITLMATGAYAVFVLFRV